MRAIDRAGAEHREMLMVCSSALSELLIGHWVTYTPTPHFPYCIAHMVKLKPVVGVSFQGETFQDLSSLSATYWFQLSHIRTCISVQLLLCVRVCQPHLSAQNLGLRNKVIWDVAVCVYL